MGNNGIIDKFSFIYCKYKDSYQLPTPALCTKTKKLTIIV